MSGSGKTSLRLSVIVATIGRPSLARALESVSPSPHDEIIVVSRQLEVSPLAEARGALFRHWDGPQIAGGAYERQHGIEQATGDYLIFLDDDDVMAPEGLEIVRAEAGKLEAPLPLLFRVQEPGGFIWSQQPSLVYGEVTGSQFVPPNSKLVPWPIDPCGDQPFIESVIGNWGGYKAVDRVIIRIRPELIHD